MRGSIKILLNSLKQGLTSLYGSRLRGIYLYGSYATGEQDAESDVDVLIVLDRVDNYAEEIDRSGPLVSKLSIEHGGSVSRVFVSEHEWLTRQTPFLESVRKEATPA